MPKGTLRLIAIRRRAGSRAAAAAKGSLGGATWWRSAGTLPARRREAAPRPRHSAPAVPDGEPVEGLRVGPGGDPAALRLQADQAAPGGGDADRAGAVGAHRPGDEPAATAAAAPPLEPPGAWPSCQGLRVAPKVGDSVKCHWPTSGAWVLPTMIAPPRAGGGPARRPSGSPDLAAAAERGRVAGEVDVVLDRHRHPEQRRPLSPPSSRSARRRRRAPLSQRTRKALRLDCVRSMRSSARSVNSSALTSPAASASA